MKKDILSGKWKQLRGSVRETWGKLTDDELDQIAGKRDKFLGVIQEKYGYTKVEAGRQLDEFLQNLETKDPA